MTAVARGLCGSDTGMAEGARAVISEMVGGGHDRPGGDGLVPRVPSAAIASIAVGFAPAIGVFIAGPVTGGAVNPARALGPMVVAGDLSSFWVYLLGPLAGAAAAAFLYDRVAVKAEAPDAQERSDSTDAAANGRDRDRTPERARA